VGAVIRQSHGGRSRPGFPAPSRAPAFPLSSQVTMQRLEERSTELQRCDSTIWVGQSQVPRSASLCQTGQRAAEGGLAPSALLASRGPIRNRDPIPVRPERGELTAALPASEAHEAELPEPRPLDLPTPRPAARAPKRHGAGPPVIGPARRCLIAAPETSPPASCGAFGGGTTLGTLDCRSARAAPAHP
jgi:hypothetical protein